MLFKYGANFNGLSNYQETQEKFFTIPDEKFNMDLMKKVIDFLNNSKTFLSDLLKIEKNETKLNILFDWIKDLNRIKNEIESATENETE